MANKIYTLDQFNSFKEGVLGRHIARKKISLSEIHIISESVVKYSGLSFQLDPAAFGALMRMVGITKQFRAKLIKELGQNFMDKLIEILSARSGGSKSEAIMLVDVKKKKILNFVQGETSMITNQNYLSEISKIVDSYGLQISDMNHRDNGGFSISTIAPNSEWGLQGLKDEVFKFGLNFENDPVKGTRIAPFNQRLVCTNGMTTTQMLGATSLINTKDSWEHFHQTVSALSNKGFRPEEFGAAVKGSMGVKASVAELEAARNLIKANSVLDDQTLEMYLPWMETEAAYKAAGQDLNYFSKEKKKNAKTSETYWDLINHITYISSNVTGHGVKNQDRLQMHAGALLSKTPDCANLIDSPFD